MKSKIEDLLGRVALIAIFAMFLLIGLWRMQKLLAEPWATSTWLLDVLVRTGSVAFLLLVVATTLIRLPARNTAEGIEPRVSAIIGTFAMLTVIVLPKGEIGAEAKVVAATIILVGTALSIYCLYWLGRSFSVMAHARALVTEGPYSTVRHPLYAAEMLALLGITIANYSIPTALVAALTVAFQFRRMHNEERVLRTTFPDYENYSQRVPMIIPAFTRRASRRAE